MEEREDKYYIDKILKGDSNSFGVLVDKYKNMAFTLANSIVKNTEIAEEVAQDGFMKAFKGLSKFEGKAKFSTWLYRITYYSSLDKIKGKKYDTVTIDEFNSSKIISSEGASDSIERDERNILVNRCMKLLPADYSSLLTLHYFEDMSLKEISDITGMKVNNAKIKLFRARQKLAIILKEQLEPETLNYYG